MLGTGHSSGQGGTLIWELHAQGAELVVLSRILPIVGSLLLARWAVRRLGSAVMDPVPLLALIAMSLSLRLVFEQNLYGYYFMALAVSLVLVDVVSGRIRGQLVAWLGLLTLAFNPLPWGFSSNAEPWFFSVHVRFPLVFMVIGTFVIASDVIRGRVRWYPVAWLIVVVVASANLPPWELEPIRRAMPNWFWQIVLLPTGIALAAGPLLSYRRNRGLADEPATPEMATVGLSSLE